MKSSVLVKRDLVKLTNWLFGIMAFLLLGTMVGFMLLVNQHENDGFLINMSGRQRLLSQRITKTTLLLIFADDSTGTKQRAQKLQTDITEFSLNHKQLKANVNSVNVVAYLNEIQPYYEAILDNSGKLIRGNDRETYLNRLLDAETNYVEISNKIVYQYEIENSAKISNFKYFLVLSTLFIAIALFLLIHKIIRPSIVENHKNSELIEQKNSELSILNDTKSTLFSIISHDLKNLFNHIIGLSDLVLVNEKGFDKEKILHFLTIINNSAKETYVLLDNLLQWSLLQQNSLEINYESIEIDNLFTEIKSQLRNQANQKEIEIISALSPNTIITSDKNVVKCVLRNLGTNALKFSNKNGKIEFRVDIGQEFATFSVKDYGIGISSDKVEELFSSEINKSEKGTSGEPGTGIGLSLCKELVERVGGKIWVKSELGIGSDFNFTIPLSRN